MKTEEINSQEDLNDEMKRREREEYYEDKLLELKMQQFLNNYLVEHELSKYKNKLSELQSEKESLLKEKEDLSQKITNIEKEKTNYEKTIKELDTKITQAKNTKKEIESNINTQQEYLQNMAKEDNLLNFIIKNFSDEFKKEIYGICSKKVDEVLKNNNSDNFNNTNEEKKSDSNKNDSNLKMVSGQRATFTPYPQNMTGMPNMANMKPLMFNPYMYPIYMPMGQNMQYPNPYFFVPMPLNQNKQKKKESNKDNNKNK